MHLQDLLTELVKSELFSDSQAHGSAKIDELKEVTIMCFAALTEKSEGARGDLVQNSEVVLALVEVLSSEAQLTTLQLAAFDLLRSIGRARLAKKRILRELFTEKKLNFVDRVSKQFLMACERASTVDKTSADHKLALQMRLMTLRVINNFGVDFKQFISKDRLL